VSYLARGAGIAAAVCYVTAVQSDDDTLRAHGQRFNGSASSISAPFVHIHRCEFYEGESPLIPGSAHDRM